MCRVKLLKSINQIFNYVIVCLLLGYVAYYFYTQNHLVDQSTTVKKIEMSSQDVDKVVNKYMKQTSQQMLKERYESDAALNRALKEPVVLSKKPTVNPEDIPVEKQIRKNQDDESPAEVVNKRIYDERSAARQEALDKKEYARQFIENARRDGLDIVLSDDLKVISVTPIRKPSQQSDTVEPIPSN